MKKILVFIIAFLFTLSSFSQVDVSKDLEVKRSFQLGANKAFGISKNGTVTSKSDSFLITEAAAKHYTDLLFGGTIQNGIISGTISRQDSTVTVTNLVYTLNGITYTKNSFQNIFHFASPGYTRYDIIYVSAAGNVDTVRGVQDTARSIYPNIPPGALQVGVVTVTGSTFNASNLSVSSNFWKPGGNNVAPGTSNFIGTTNQADFSIGTSGVASIVINGVDRGVNVISPILFRKPLYFFNGEPIQISPTNVVDNINSFNYGVGVYHNQVINFNNTFDKRHSIFRVDPVINTGSNNLRDSIIGFDYDPLITSQLGTLNVAFRATSGQILFPNLSTTTGQQYVLVRDSLDGRLKKQLLSFGSATNIYNTNGTLTGTRQLSLANNNLIFSDGSFSLFLSPSSQVIQLNANGDGVQLDGTNHFFEVTTNTSQSFKQDVNGFAFTGGSKVGINKSVPTKMLDIVGNVGVTDSVSADKGYSFISPNGYKLKINGTSNGFEIQRTLSNGSGYTRPMFTAERAKLISLDPQGVKGFTLDGGDLTSDKILRLPDESDTLATKTFVRSLVGSGGGGSGLGLKNIKFTNSTGIIGVIDSITDPTRPALSLTLTKSSVGLSNVDNTSDVNKPVSTLQNNAIRDTASSIRITVNNIKSITDSIYTLNYLNSDFNLNIDSAGHATLSLKKIDVFGEELTSSGSTVVTFSHNYISGSIRLFRNGVRISKTLYTETSSNSITLSFTPIAGDTLIKDYKY